MEMVTMTIGIFFRFNQNEIQNIAYSVIKEFA